MRSLLRIAPAAVSLVLSLSLIPVWASGSKRSRPLSKDEKILQTLNRLQFGPTPGEEKTVKKIGLNKWINRQLHPDSIAESPMLLAKLQPLDTLRMTPLETARKYPSNLQIRQMAEGKAPWPDDPEVKLAAERMAERYREKISGNTEEKITFDQALAPLNAAARQVFQSGAPEAKAAALRSLSLAQQYDLLTTMPRGQRAKLYSAAPEELQRRMRLFGGTQQLVSQDLFDAKIYRAVYSNRQLQEVLTDFWYNHFNVHLDKGADRYLVTSYERDAIRPYVLGRFQDLLLATAESPAMLFYLDNFQSVAPGAAAGAKGPMKRARQGLNENYGRELLELHTLGVDGGYTQHDVTEVARCFTGWTIRTPFKGGGFEFNEKLHDKAEKTVLGVKIAAGGGMEDGLKVVEILSNHPATARFISRSLATRFVSDVPPQALVERMAATFLHSHGDLRAVMITMIKSPEFWSRDVYRAKIKTPFEMVVSSLRATNASIDFTNSIVGELSTLGEPLYRKQEPTGFSNKGSDWLNSGALLGRLNFGLNLTANKIPGVRVPATSSLDPDEVAQALVGARLSPESRQAVERGLAGAGLPAAPSPAPGGNRTPALVAGLTLGSPDFQRH